MTKPGLLLDLDGTLADSLDVLERAYRAFAEEMGFHPTKEEFERLNGPPLKDGAKILRDAHGLSGSSADLANRYLDIATALYRDVPPAKNAETVLEKAKAQNWHIAVVTSAPRHLAEAWLDRWKLAPFIDVLISADDPHKAKPSPEPYLAGLKALGISPGNALAVEDSKAGVSSARAAGLTTLCVGSRIEGADQIPSLESMLDIIEANSTQPNLSIVRSIPIAPNLRVRILKEPYIPPADLDERIESLWKQATAASGKMLFNGIVMSLTAITDTELTVQPNQYRTYTAQLHDPALYPALGIQPLACSGVLTCKDGLVFARRTEKVSIDPGKWELAPSGTMDDTVIQEDGFANFAGLLCHELEEELGLPASRVRVGQAVGLYEHLAGHGIDLAVAMETDASADDLRHAFSTTPKEEYDELKILGSEEIAAFSVALGPNMVEVSRQALYTLGYI